MPPVPWAMPGIALHQRVAPVGAHVVWHSPVGAYVVWQSPWGWPPFGKFARQCLHWRKPQLG